MKYQFIGLVSFVPSTSSVSIRLYWNANNIVFILDIPKSFIFFNKGKLNS